MTTQTSFELEDIVLQNLQYNEDYARKVLPYLDKNMFSGFATREYYSVIDEFFTKYSKLPTKEVIEVELSSGLYDEVQAKNLKEISDKVNSNYTKPDDKWLLDSTEKWCKQVKLLNALHESYQIHTGQSKSSLTVSAIPDILSNALAFSFDTDIGHDYFDNALDRYDFFHRKVAKIPFVLDDLNDITNGGVERKTLSAFIAQTNAGKSIMMCNLAAGYIQQGYNVLLITLEMGQEKLAERIDANLLNMPIDSLWNTTRDDFKNKIDRLKTGVKGILKVKEYPTSSAHVGHFKILLKELEQKQKFKPDIIIIDYLNICASSKIKSRQDMYAYNKSIAEELRALAQETNTAMWTCLQFNRSGMNSTDADLTNTSESIGIAYSLDFLLGMIVTEELTQMGQVLIKQLKSRFGDLNKKNKFILGLDKLRMKFYQLNNSGTSSNVLTNSNQGNINNKKVSNPIKPNSAISNPKTITGITV